MPSTPDLLPPCRQSEYPLWANPNCPQCCQPLKPSYQRLRGLAMFFSMIFFWSDLSMWTLKRSEIFVGMDLRKKNCQRYQSFLAQGSLALLLYWSKRCLWVNTHMYMQQNVCILSMNWMTYMLQLSPWDTTTSYSINNNLHIHRDLYIGMQRTTQHFVPTQCSTGTPEAIFRLWFMNMHAPSKNGVLQKHKYSLHGHPPSKQKSQLCLVPPLFSASLKRRIHRNLSRIWW